jgi:hypothetical protein
MLNDSIKNSPHDKSPESGRSDDPFLPMAPPAPPDPSCPAPETTPCQSEVKESPLGKPAPTAEPIVIPIPATPLDGEELIAKSARQKQGAATRKRQREDSEQSEYREKAKKKKEDDSNFGPAVFYTMIFLGVTSTLFLVPLGIHFPLFWVGLLLIYGVEIRYFSERSDWKKRNAEPLDSEGSD